MEQDNLIIASDLLGDPDCDFLLSPLLERDRESDFLFTGESMCLSSVTLGEADLDLDLDLATGDPVLVGTVATTDTDGGDETPRGSGIDIRSSAALSSFSGAVTSLEC